MDLLCHKINDSLVWTYHLDWRLSTQNHPPTSELISTIILLTSSTSQQILFQSHNQRIMIYTDNSSPAHHYVIWTHKQTTFISSLSSLPFSFSSDHSQMDNRLRMHTQTTNNFSVAITYSSFSPLSTITSEKRNVCIHQGYATSLWKVEVLDSSPVFSQTQTWHLLCQAYILEITETDIIFLLCLLVAVYALCGENYITNCELYNKNLCTYMW